MARNNAWSLPQQTQQQQQQSRFNAASSSLAQHQSPGPKLDQTRPFASGDPFFSDSCAAAHIHTLRLQLADLESRAAFLDPSKQLQPLVEQFMKEHLPLTLKSVLNEMVRNDRSSSGGVGETGSTTMGAEGSSPQPSYEQSSGSSAPRSVQHTQAASFQPSRPPPPATTTTAGATAASLTPPPAASSMPSAATTALEAARSEVNELREHLAEAQSELLSIDASLTTAAAREASLASLRALAHAGGLKGLPLSKLKAHNNLKQALEFMEEKTAALAQAEAQLQAAQQEVDREEHLRLSSMTPPAAAVVAPASPSKSQWAQQHASLQEAGFLDYSLNQSMLDRSHGDVNAAMDKLLALDTLASAGFTDHALNVMQLDKSQWNVEVVMLQLKKRRELKANAAAGIKREPVAAAAPVAASLSASPAAPQQWQPPAASILPQHPPAPVAVAAATSASSLYPPQSSISSHAPVVKMEAGVNHIPSASSMGGANASIPRQPQSAGAAASSSAQQLPSAPQSWREAQLMDAPDFPAPLEILRQCGFRAFDFTYRTSAVNHIKSLLRDKLKMSAQELANDVWHFESRYNIQGIQEWRSCVSFRNFKAAEPSSWYLVKTQSTEESAVHALRAMKMDRELKNLFLRPLPPIDDLNPISAVRNAIRDRSLWKNCALDEHLSIAHTSFQCRLRYGEAEVGSGTGSEKVFAKTNASIDTLTRWNNALDYIRKTSTEELAKWKWMELND